MWADDPASQGLGMRLEDVAPGRARFSFVVTEAMVNSHGVCHGGFIFALADSAVAFAANSHGEHAVTQHCSITFVRPGRLGETLTAEAVERTRSGRSGIYDVRVSGADGDVVAEFRGHSRTTGGRYFAEG
jgi:acyl-CoA thioesterase